MQQISIRKFFLNLLIIAAASICTVFAITTISTQDKASAHESEYSTLADYLIHLRDSNIYFYIGFTSPVAGDVGWDIPEDILSDGQVVGHRTIKEIGDDYICLDEWGEGISFISCIPFANISSIQHHPAPHPP
jgi:hypothetical protein